MAEEFRLVKPKAKSDEWSEPAARFQLSHMGPHMEVESPGVRDPRVEAFNPDLWQRELFDVVDTRGSALIVAPTSSGEKHSKMGIF